MLGCSDLPHPPGLAWTFSPPGKSSSRSGEEYLFWAAAQKTSKYCERGSEAPSRCSAHLAISSFPSGAQAPHPSASHQTGNCSRQLLVLRLPLAQQLCTSSSDTLNTVFPCLCSALHSFYKRKKRKTGGGKIRIQRPRKKKKNQTQTTQQRLGAGRASTALMALRAPGPQILVRLEGLKWQHSM